MGCGESKQAVATENILTKSKSKSKNLQNNPPVENPTNEKSEEGNENSSKIEGQKEKEVVDDQKNGNKEPGVEKTIDEGVVVEENIKGDGKKDEEVMKGEKEKVVVPNGSPKKDDDYDNEETIESNISEGISGKSGYYSPRAKGHVTGGSDAGEKDIAEAKLSKEKDEVLKVDEAKESASADETESSGVEKTSAAESETANAASTTDVKAN